MKIGLLTYFGDLNCGTNMQALSTFLALKKAYPHDAVEIIPFHGFRAKWLPYKTFSPVNLWNDMKRFMKYHEFKRKQLHVAGDIVIKDVDKALQYIASLVST